MDAAFAIVAILAIVVVGLAWKVRKASVETVVAPSADARSAPREMQPGEIVGDVGSLVNEEIDRGAAPPSAAEPRSPSPNTLVTVFATYDYAELLIAKSLLEAADIPYFAKGEAAQNLFGGHLWAGHNFALGPVELQVPADLGEEARSLLENPEPLEE
jgi:Putative prokaryotic signal transducing protein